MLCVCTFLILVTDFLHEKGFIEVSVINTHPRRDRVIERGRIISGTQARACSIIALGYLLVAHKSIPEVQGLATSSTPAENCSNASSDHRMPTESTTSSLPADTKHKRTQNINEISKFKNFRLTRTEASGLQSRK